MEFEKKDFEQLHISKVRDCLIKNTVSNNYFFCMDKKLIFICKYRKMYKICASSQCGFKPEFRESVFDVVFVSEDLEQTISYFEFLIKLIFARIEK